MYLSKLEIFGFKSFAQKTIINFTKGITGIVGPNGCGKTNIVDAIRWCLGEQKSSMLRSDKMENVIFNGTRIKKPMGMAEVSLTIINDIGILPTEFSEVTLTRRIFRSGESEYLLNKNICRLKDITNLFMDTGMGTNAYSVIELKMVEVILSNKADERRHMFEEAAGVNKYKLRRRLALKKLDDIKSDLTRVNDIVSEVEKTVRSLERQAKKADRYTRIQTVLKEQELDLAEREYTLLASRENTFTLEKQNLTNGKNEIDRSIKETENELIVYRDKIQTIEKELNSKHTEISTQTEKLHEKQNSISVAEERFKALETNFERYKYELDELNMQNSETDNLIISGNSHVKEIDELIRGKELEISGMEKSHNDKRTAVEEKRQMLKLINDEMLNISKEISLKENQHSTINISKERVNTSITKLNDKIQKCTSDIAKSVGFLEELKNEKSDALKKLEQSEFIFTQQQKEKEKLEKELNNLRDKELEEKGLINGLKNKIEFLQTLITNLEGISKASKVLIESEGWTDKEKILFADVGNTDEQFRFALEASLKTVLNNLLIENFTDLEKAVEYLKKNDLGKASFYLLQDSEKRKKSILDRILSYSEKRNIKKIEKESSFLNWAHMLVQADAKWKPYFEKVLAKTAVTKNLSSAKELNIKYPEFNFATLDGDLVNASGIVEAGSSPKSDETLFGRKRLLEDLKADYPKYENNLEKLKLQIRKTEEQISSIDLNTLSERGKILLNDINNIEKQISQFEFEKQKTSEEIEKSQTEINELAGELNRLDNELISHKSDLDQNINLREGIENKIRSFEEENKSLEDDYDKFVSEFNEKKLQLEKLRGQLNNTKAEITRSEKAKIKIAETMRKRSNDIAFTEAEITVLNKSMEEMRIEFNDLNKIRQEMIISKENINNNLQSIKEEASTFENELNDKRNNREEISDKIHEASMQLKEITIKSENLRELIKDEYSLELKVKEFPDSESFDFKERSTEVHSLKEKLKNLGPINLLAYSEYEEEKERMEFLQNQRNDLIESEKDLVRTIREINETAHDLFINTFEKIKTNFRKIFQSLFSEDDEADLILEEGTDPLESKIDIIAKPKGKRPTSIELLSGGEKTLTATALLFAIYLVKPSPFCILDEVDAPLDDANIDRFTKLLNDFRKDTQFIIVTHNKRTMEASENMYGVTMQEEGISKLVGVQFNEQLEVAS